MESFITLSAQLTKLRCF